MGPSLLQENIGMALIEGLLKDFSEGSISLDEMWERIDQELEPNTHTCIVGPVCRI